MALAYMEKNIAITWQLHL